MDITSLVDAARKRRDQQYIVSLRQRGELLRAWLTDIGLESIPVEVEKAEAAFSLDGDEHTFHLADDGSLFVDWLHFSNEAGEPVPCKRADFANGDLLLLRIAEEIGERNARRSRVDATVVDFEDGTTIAISMQPEEPKPARPARSKPVRPARG